MEGLKQVSQSDLQKLFKKNALLDVLGNEGQQIVVVGDTSTGKSTVINFLLGFPINFEASGIGTRRPCVLTQVQKPGQKTVQFEARFCKGGDTVIEPLTEDASRVAKVVAKANDHHNIHYFSCLEPDCSVEDAYDKAFDGEPVYVKMFHEDFKYGLRLVDLPGLTRRNPSPMIIAKSYIQPGNVAILVMGKDNAANGGFPDLAEVMTQCEQVLVCQNFAYTLLKGGRNVQDNHDVIKSTFAKKNCPHADTLTIYCVDFGKPKNEEFASIWKASTQKQVEDQEDWPVMAASGGLEVQKRMYGHASEWGKRLKRECEKDACKDGRAFDWGILPVLNKVVDFQLFEIDRQIGDLKDKVGHRIEEKTEHLEELYKNIEALKDPAEWQDLISRLAKVVAEFLDTTIALPDEKEDPEINKALMAISEEVDETIKHMEAQPKDVSDVGRGDGNSDRGIYYWFTEDMDQKIRQLCHRPLEVDEKLCNLRSWQRLLDELTAMLAFAPMPYIAKAKKLQAYQRVGSGQAAEMNKLDIMVELVSEAKINNRPPIHALLQTFKYRFLYLAERDLKNCMKMFKQDLTHELRAFLKLLGEDTPERREELCEELQKGLIDNMKKCVRNTIDGVYLLDKKGNPKTDSVTGKFIKLERSGLCVRHKENQGLAQGACHWLLPFKAHYVNGQIPWKDLKMSAEGMGDDAENYDETEHDTENPNINDLHEDHVLEEIVNTSKQDSMNAVNAVNMQIFNLATQPYDVVLSFDHKEGREFDPFTDLEIMKMLKAMQAEIAAFWASEWKGMIQRIKDESHQARELEDSIESHLSAAGLLHNIDATKLKNDLKMAINSVSAVISGTEFPDNIAKDTFKEIADMGNDMGRCPWPGLDMPTFRSLLDKFSSDEDHVHMDCFPETKDRPIAGEYAWIRLCEEFIFVILQLAMKRASRAEISMAKASSGKSTLAGGFEIVTKLVLHRLRTIGQDSGRFFRQRMVNLYERDLKHALAQIQGFNLGEIVPGKTGVQFVEDFLRDRAADVVDRTLANLQNKFDELTPFDFSILNGRLPLLKAVMRKIDFELSENSTPEAVMLEDADTEGTLRECWEKSLLAQWPVDLVGKLIVEPEDALKGKGLVLAHETNSAAFGCLNDAEAIRLVTAFGNLPDKDPPAPNMAGGAFHSMLLRIHKAMHVNAIDFCRPKLKDMMANIYQEDRVRSQLQRNHFLSKKAFETTALKRTQEAKEIEAKIDMMHRALELANQPPPPEKKPDQHDENHHKHWWGGW